jgi:hypothetical protein
MCKQSHLTVSLALLAMTFTEPSSALDSEAGKPQQTTPHNFISPRGTRNSGRLLQRVHRENWSRGNYRSYRNLKDSRAPRVKRIRG